MRAVQNLSSKLNPQYSTAMLKLTSSVLLLASALVALPLFAQSQKKGKMPLPGAGTGGNSPHHTTSRVIGPNRNEGGMITITYGRPSITHPRSGERRKIWGGLVPWDKPYRLGADEATLLINSLSMEIDGTTIPAGAYTLYMIPSASGTSKLAFSRNIGKWGVPVDVDSDLARVDLKKEPLNERVEQLTIAVENDPPRSRNGILRISWENTQFSVPFAIKE